MEWFAVGTATGTMTVSVFVPPILAHNHKRGTLHTGQLRDGTFESDCGRLKGRIQGTCSCNRRPLCRLCHPEP